MRPTEQRALRILRLGRQRASVRSPAARGSAPVVVVVVAVVVAVVAEVAEVVVEVAEVVEVEVVVVAEVEVAEVAVAEVVVVVVAAVVVVAEAVVAEVAAAELQCLDACQRGRGAVTAAGGDDRVPDERGTGEGALRVQGRLAAQAFAPGSKLTTPVVVNGPAKGSPPPIAQRWPSATTLPATFSATGMLGSCVQLSLAML